MEIIQVFAVIFLFILAVCVAVATPDEKGRKERRGQEPPRVIVTQRVPSVFELRDHRPDHRR